MALWRSEGRRKWIEIRALNPYFPPIYMRISPDKAPAPRWTAVSQGAARYGADSLPELIQALLAACRRPGTSGTKRLWRVTEEGLANPVEAIAPFRPEEIWKPGVELARLRRPPDRWLITLRVARPTQKALWAAQAERYLATWRTALEALLEACQG